MIKNVTLFGVGCEVGRLVVDKLVERSIEV